MIEKLTFHQDHLNRNIKYAPDTDVITNKVNELIEASNRQSDLIAKLIAIHPKLLKELNDGTA